MATPIDDRYQRYEKFIFDSLVDEHGGWTQPYDQVVLQATAEWSQLTEAFRTRLFVLIMAADNFSRAMDLTARTLNDEYGAACGIWDSLPVPVQQETLQHVDVLLNQYLNRNAIMATHYATISNECRANNVTEGPRLQGQFPVTHDMASFIQAATTRRQDIVNQRLTVLSNEQLYRNPTQSVPQGNKIQGRHRIPLALRNLWRRQMLLPAPTVTNLGWQSSQQALPHDPNRVWQGASLGAGGMGTTRVFAQRNAANNVTSRLVIKDCDKLDENDRRDRIYWYGDLTDEDWETTCVPMEYHTQKLVGDNPETKNVVKVYGPPFVNWDEGIYRILMEFAPEGDLKQLINRHQDHQEPIPEKFIWMCFRGLVEACMVMKQGGLAQAANPWSEIVHRDLKPENVFLARPNPNYYSHWPTPQVGDFGLAIMTSSNDPTNPYCYSRAGTEGYMAPEQLHYVDDVNKTPVDASIIHIRPTFGAQLTDRQAFKMLSPCNVYGIGAILFCMIEQRTLGMTAQPSFLPGTPPNVFAVDAFYRTLYSNELCQLVESCMDFNPGNRPTLQFLRTQLDIKLFSQEFNSDRGGTAGPEDDTLLLPNDIVRLKWASRMNGNANDARVPRVPGDGSTVYGN